MLRSKRRSTKCRCLVRTHVARVPCFLLLTAILFSSGVIAQPVSDDWVRNDRVVSMGGLYTHGAWSVDVGDIDSDGIDDLVFTTTDGTLEMYRGTGRTGDKAWERRLEWSSGIHLELPSGPGSEFSYGWFVAVTDLNGNGLPELVLTSGDWDHQPLCLERTEDEPFMWLRAQHLMGTLPGFICVAGFRDVEGDGDDDLAATLLLTQWGDMYTVLFWNDGDASSPMWRLDDTYFFPEAWDHLSIDFADVDEDQDHDLLVLDFCPECCVCPYILLNVGTGLDPSWECYDPPPGYWMEPVCCADKGDLVVFDQDADGDEDIVVLTAPIGQLHRYENYSSGDSLCIDGPELAAGLIWGRPTLSDLDWDGDNDLVVSFTGVDLSGPTTGTAEYRNDGTADDPLWVPTRQFRVPGGGGLYVHMTMADLDDDTHDDVLVLRNEPAFYWRRGSATQPVWEYDPNVSAEFANVPYASDPGFVDFDGDGLLDFTCRYQSGRRMFRNVGESGSPTWVEWPAWADGLPNAVMAFGLLDTDRYVDAVVAGLDSTLHCFLGSPGKTPLWIETQLYLSGLKLPAYPGKMLLTNLDGGAANDLLTQFGSVAFYTNTGPVGAENAPMVQNLWFSISPNPLRIGGMLEMHSPRSGPFTVSLFDLSGRLMERILEGEMRSNEIMVITPWPASLDLPNGTHIASAEAGGQRVSKRIVVIR